MPAVDLDQFAADMADRVKTFAEKYRKRHKENPEHYPIVFPDDNAGVWYEMFMIYCETGDV